MKPSLSVIVPTYNRLDRLIHTFPLIVAEKSKNIEFIIVDNASKDGTEQYFKDYIKNDNRISYFKNPTNLGPNRNIYRGYLESKADWFIILPDDDFIGTFFLKELLIVILNNSMCGLLIPCIQNQIKVFNETTIVRKGIKGFEHSFKNSGCITGIAFNKDFIKDKEWLLDGYIYPQIKLACDISLVADLIYFVPTNPPTIGDWSDTIIQIANERPIDFGIIERLEILIEVSKKVEKSNRTNLRHTLSAGLFLWAIGSAKSMYVNNKEHTLKYIKSLLKHKFIKSSSIFLGLLILKLVLNNQITLIMMYMI